MNKFDENCIFCKIAKGEIPTTPVYETDDVIAFNDLNPQAPVHILVIPKAHYSSLIEIDDIELLGKVTNAVREITKKLGITSYRTVINTGAQAGQTVMHLHFHIMAGRAFTWPAG
ncbi:MAG TPA: histidine triad nucleotide-binding protein [Candidatus Adamsella sp.]|nr:histidine triad nucleotide-binding protein [Candidatus Adamsella sp.]